MCAPSHSHGRESSSLFRSSGGEYMAARPRRSPLYPRLRNISASFSGVVAWIARNERTLFLAPRRFLWRDLLEFALALFNLSWLWCKRMPALRTLRASDFIAAQHCGQTLTDVAFFFFGRSSPSSAHGSMRSQCGRQSAPSCARDQTTMRVLYLARAAGYVRTVGGRSLRIA